MRRSSHGEPRAQRAAHIERLRWLIQPAALWIGVVGALFHIAVTASPQPDPAVAVTLSVEQARSASAVCPGALHGVASLCQQAGGDRCDVSEVIGPHEAIATAEEVLLGEKQADRAQLRFEHTSGVLVWTVHDEDAHASIDLDAFTGEVVAFQR